MILSLHELELAQKVSDYVLCVKGEYADRYGTPEEIFKEEYIRRLYDLDNGYYSEIFGSVEIKRDAGKMGERSPAADVSAANDAGKPGTPEVFVIAGGGSGRLFSGSFSGKASLSRRESCIETISIMNWRVCLRIV